MITSHLKSATTGPARLFIRLYGPSGQLINETNYKAADIYEDHYHPFGFPLQPLSQGKTYTLEYELTQADPARGIKLIADGEKFISVYFRPGNQWRWLINKLVSPLTSPMYWLTLLNLAPLLIMLNLNRFKGGGKNVGQ